MGPKLIPKLTEKEIIHFWSKVDIKGPDECWEWMGCLNKDNGYGQIGFNIKYIVLTESLISCTIKKIQQNC